MKEIENNGVLTEIKELLQKQNIFNKGILNFDEAVAYMGVSRSFLHKLTSQNKIGCKRPKIGIEST